jgi:hypothetical protein
MIDRSRRLFTGRPPAAQPARHSVEERQLADHAERVQLVGMLWKVAYADGQLHDYVARGTGRSLPKRWSGRLAEELIADINPIEIDVDCLDVFIDINLDPAVELTPTLREEVKRAGLLLLIMSPHCPNSSRRTLSRTAQGALYSCRRSSRKGYTQ